MTNTAILTEDTATIISDGARHFHWGAVIAGALAATATTFFLVTLGSGIGLVVAANAYGAATFLTLGAIYVFVAQAFGFAVGGYLVGRLIGPETETDKEEEFRAAAHGFTVWSLAVVAGLLIAGYTAMPRAGMPGVEAGVAAPSAYRLDMLFRPAANTPLVAADKMEVRRIWSANGAHGENTNDDARVARLVSQDAGLSTSEALNRTRSVQTMMQQDMARKTMAVTYLALWTAFALLFGAVVCVAAAISARWMDDKVSFGFAPRRR